MTPTGLRALASAVLVGAVVGYLLAPVGYASIPPLPAYAPVTLVLLAVFELGLARSVRVRLRGLPRGGRALHPLQVARAVVLAKASSAGAAVLVGGYLGLLLYVAPLQSAAARRDAVVCVVSAVASLLLVGAALLLERACRTPDPSP